MADEELARLREGGESVVMTFASRHKALGGARRAVHAAGRRARAGVPLSARRRRSAKEEEAMTSTSSGPELDLAALLVATREYNASLGAGHVEAAERVIRTYLSLARPTALEARNELELAQSRLVSYDDAATIREFAAARSPYKSKSLSNKMFIEAVYDIAKAWIAEYGGISAIASPEPSVTTAHDVPPDGVAHGQGGRAGEPPASSFAEIIEKAFTDPVEYRPTGWRETYPALREPSTAEVKQRLLVALASVPAPSGAETVAWRYRLFKETKVWTYTHDRREAECRMNPNYEVQMLYATPMLTASPSADPASGKGGA